MTKNSYCRSQQCHDVLFYLFLSGEFFNIYFYRFKSYADVYVRRSCFIIFLFKKEIIHQMLKNAMLYPF